MLIICLCAYSCVILFLKLFALPWTGCQFLANNGGIPYATPFPIVLFFLSFWNFYNINLFAWFYLEAEGMYYYSNIRIFIGILDSKRTEII